MGCYCPDYGYYRKVERTGNLIKIGEWDIDTTVYEPAKYTLNEKPKKPKFYFMHRGCTSPNRFSNFHSGVTWSVGTQNRKLKRVKCLRCEALINGESYDALEFMLNTRKI